MLNRGEMYPFDLIYDITMLLRTMVSSIYKLSENFRMENNDKSFKLRNEKRLREMCRGRMGGFRVSVRRGIKCSASGVIS